MNELGSEFILQLSDIDKSFSLVKVLEKVNLSLRKGMILGLVGENGAGKSTLMNILGGVVPRDSGEMFLDGKKYDPKRPIDATNVGIAFIHQELILFTNLSVMENIFIDKLPLKGPLQILDLHRMRTEATRILKEFDETISVTALVGDLSMGCRQMVEIAKALHVNGKIIIFDEPTTSLSTKEKEKLFDVIRKLKQQQVSIIYISHVIDDVLKLCDEITVLRDGHVIGTGISKSLSKEEVIKMMVGRDLQRLFPYTEKKPGTVILNVEHLSRGKILRDVSLTLREGEIVGLFGLMGAGRSELARALFGVDKVDGGSVTIGDLQAQELSPSASIHKGISFITENRREEGLIMTKSVKDNLVLVFLRKLRGKLLAVDEVLEDKISDQAIRDVRIKTYDKNSQTVGSLSGGNQQKVVIGKWMVMKPRIFLLDEPTRGIDVGAKLEIYNYINELASNRSAILFISSEMEELMGICDRILVMSQGQITAEIRREEYDQELIMKRAIGGTSCNES